MSEVEHLVQAQQKQIETLIQEVADLKSHIEDFERIAHVWKKSYQDMEAKYRIQLGNAAQSISQLEEELRDFKTNRDY